MDALFNKLVPPSKPPDMLVIRPFGKTFITGLASSYTVDSYDADILAPYIARKEFTAMIESLNEVLYANWPCGPCQMIGYILCPCTLGLSFLLPSITVSEAKH